MVSISVRFFSVLFFLSSAVSIHFSNIFGCAAMKEVRFNSDISDRVEVGRLDVGINEKARVVLTSPGGTGFVWIPLEITSGDEFADFNINETSEDLRKIMTERRSLSDHGVTVTYPTNVESSTTIGGPASFESFIEASQTGRYAVKFVHVRAFSPNEGALFKVVAMNVGGQA